MADDLWILIPNWDKFQHYRDRTPAWIKVYTELDSDAGWDDLTYHERGLLVTIWITYARSRGVLPVSRCVRRRDNRYANAMRAIDSLVSAGFITLSASKPLAQRREEKEKKVLSARARKTETRRDEKLTPDPTMVDMAHDLLKSWTIQ